MLPPQRRKPECMTTVVLIRWVMQLNHLAESMTLQVEVILNKIRHLVIKTKDQAPTWSFRLLQRMIRAGILPRSQGTVHHRLSRRVP